MGCTSKLAHRIFMFVSWVIVVNSAQKCVVTCSLGEYCSGSVCLPCPPGTYQKEPIHYSRSCKPWTDKPPHSHYIIVKNGTSESDAAWRCEDGYQEWQYTVGSFECRRMPTTTSPVSSTTHLPTSNSTDTTEPITISLHAKQHSGNDNIGVIVGGVLGGFVIIGVIVIIFILYRKRRLRFARQRLYLANGNTAQTVDSLESGSVTETEPLTPNPNSINYKYCLKFVEELGVHKLKSFLNVLYDPSEKFHAEKVIQFESSKTSDVNTYLTRSFLTWVELNKGIYRSCIVTALADIARTYVLEVIEALVPVIYLIETNTGCDDAVTYAGASGAGDETTSSAGRKVISQDRFRLYYYLAEQIEAERLRELLRQLPDSSERFNAYNHYIARLTEERDYSNAFAQTLEEWWLRNLSLSLNNILIDFLKEQSREDVLENNEFLHRLQRIAKTSNSGKHDQEQSNTCNSDRHDQEQYHSPDNSVPDDTDANQVSYNAEVGHITYDIEVEDMPNDTKREDMSNDTEREDMSNDTESKNMLGKTEKKNMLGNGEPEDIPDHPKKEPVSKNNEKKVQEPQKSERVGPKAKIEPAIQI